jgi:hypothetical protein
VIVDQDKGAADSELIDQFEDLPVPLGRHEASDIDFIMRGLGHSVTPSVGSNVHVLQPEPD